MRSKVQTLERALNIARANGWKPLSSIDWKNVKVEQWQGSGMVGIALLYTDKRDKKSAVHWARELEGIIFNHDFAKHLWGEDHRFEGPARNQVCVKCFMTDSHNLYEPMPDSCWEYNLKNMVVSDDPIKYIEKTL